MEPNLRLCLGCAKPIRGRVDKKFCDDYCRNNFNNRQNSDQNSFVRNINNILRKNRRILAGMLPETEETVKVKREKLSNEGFNYGYHTHLYLTQKGQTYSFCYEFGYLQLEHDWVLIVKRKGE
ncbi:hypothetical protein DBR32_07420 [Taibaiella sp. KBW10]|uniref:hypothetical protein n=1 Tax=Taibaiella sp. KBW10 TaxID=2153357 RepID=UPI000F5AA921|nr:hypothetical protein [Taibaiella sp. KBW10]RQO31764.1 hypothetical protein DBR32_07420 [Taibaiella sp. KBW10]